MAVIQTPRGRIIGLIIENDSQPKPEPVADKEPIVDVKSEQAKKPGRPPKK